MVFILINEKEFSVDLLQRIALDSKNKSDFAKKLGFIYFNGKVSKQIKDIIINYNIDVKHFNSFFHKKRKYELTIRECPICLKSFEISLGSPKEKQTCSYSCSNSFFAETRYGSDANGKRSKSLLKFHGNANCDIIKINNKNYTLLHKICKYCSLNFSTAFKRTNCCSKSCASKLRSQNPEYIKKLSNSVKSRINNGTFSGWKSRTKCQPSFPEKITMEILSELSICLERELPVGKWFIDFADCNRKIALEIDGKQHDLIERKMSDNKKDDFLKKNGWKVFRIKWKKLTKDFRQELKNNLHHILKD